MEIQKLSYEDFAGKRYCSEVRSDKYLAIEPVKSTNRDKYGFSFEWVACEEFSMKLEDEILSDWLENPVAFGAFSDGKLFGFVEGFLETWNNRFRISNIVVFDQERRKSGIGSALLASILQEAERSGARMVVLETQSYNFKAISFYKKHGFDIIGFDLFAYSNDAIEKHNIRIEMGKKTQNG